MCKFVHFEVCKLVHFPFNLSQNPTYNKSEAEALLTETQREVYKKKFSNVLVAYADLKLERKAIGEG